MQFDSRIQKLMKLFVDYLNVDQTIRANLEPPDKAVHDSNA
jgi:hypothetical protein